MPYFYLILIVCALDQGIKLLVQTKMNPFQSINLLQGCFSLTYVMNYGAAFGIMHSQTFLLLGVALITFVYAWWNRRELRKYPQMFQVGIALALGGALGNFIDRFRLGYVVDFIDLHYWPVFNIADVAIIGGVVLISIAMVKQEMQRKKESIGQNDSKNTVSGEENL